MAEVVERELVIDAAALEYLEWWLAEGPTLSQLLVSHLDFRRGRLTASLPMDAPQDFRDGGLYIYEEAICYLARQIAEFLQGETHGVCILQDYVRSPTDVQHGWELWGLEGAVRFWCCGQEVYYLLFAEDSLRRIAQTIDFADSLSPFVGVMTALPTEQYTEVRQKRELSAAELGELVKGTAKVFVNAYDDESYLIWSAEGGSERRLRSVRGPSL